MFYSNRIWYCIRGSNCYNMFEPVSWEELVPYKKYQVVVRRSWETEDTVFNGFFSLGTITHVKRYEEEWDLICEMVTGYHLDKLVYSNYAIIPWGVHRVVKRDSRIYEVKLPYLNEIILTTLKRMCLRVIHENEVDTTPIAHLNIINTLK